MKNVMYSVSIFEDYTIVGIYRSKCVSSIENVTYDFLEIEDDDLRLMYMENGYKNFYEEKKYLEKCILEFPTLHGKAELMKGSKNLIEKITGCGSIRLSPFVHTGRVYLTGDAELDTRNMIHRNIGIENSVNAIIRLSEATLGSSLAFEGIDDGNTIPMYIEGSVLSRVKNFYSDSVFYVHIDELDKGMLYEMPECFVIDNLCIEYDGVFDMDCFIPSKKSEVGSLFLKCGGYKNQLKWLINNIGNINGTLCISDDSGLFLSELEGLEEENGMSAPLGNNFKYIIRMPECISIRNEGTKIYRLSEEYGADRCFVSYMHDNGYTLACLKFSMIDRSGEYEKCNV